MYQSYEFTFAGMPASMYGMFICDLGSKKHSDNAFGNQAKIVETRLPNRITPIHYGVRYNDDPLTFTLIFASEHRMDRYELQEVAQWLTGYQEYQWLSIDQPDLEHIQFRCIIQSLTPISVGWFPVAFEAKIICDSPYGYSYPIERTYTVKNVNRIRYYNDSNVRELWRPILEINLACGCNAFSIENETTGEKMEFVGLPDGALTITVDNENGVITCSNVDLNLYDYFNFVFFSLVSGDNQLVINGTGTVKISGRYVYNVGA